MSANGLWPWLSSLNSQHLDGQRVPEACSIRQVRRFAGAQHPMVGPEVPAEIWLGVSEPAVGPPLVGRLSRPTVSDQWWRRSSVGCSHLVHCLWPLLCASSQAGTLHLVRLQAATVALRFCLSPSLHPHTRLSFSHSLFLRQVPKETQIKQFLDNQTSRKQLLFPGPTNWRALGTRQLSQPSGTLIQPSETRPRGHTQPPISHLIGNHALGHRLETKRQKTFFFS